MTKLEELIALADAATHPATKGRWMYLFGDRFVYDRLEDGCRGVPQCGADYLHSADDAKRLQFIAAANPATVKRICEENIRMKELLVQCRENIGAFTDPEGNMPEQTPEFYDLAGTLAALDAFEKEGK